MGKCPVLWCDKPHKNLFEHYNDEPKRGGWRVNSAVINKVTTPKSITESVINRPREAISANEGVINNVINKEDEKKTKQRERAAKWRAKHREKYTSDMREVMRKKRAK